MAIPDLNCPIVPNHSISNVIWDHLRPVLPFYTP